MLHVSNADDGAAADEWVSTTSITCQRHKCFCVSDGAEQDRSGKDRRGGFLDGGAIVVQDGPRCQASRPLALGQATPRDLAKQHIDVGLFTDNAEAMLAVRDLLRYPAVVRA